MALLLKKIRQHVPVIILTLLVMFAFMANSRGTFQWDMIKQFENWLYDARVIITLPGETDDRVVIVDIDEKSLAEIGRWPWSRDKLARLVDELFDYFNVAVVAFDIYFPEPDESSGLKILDYLGKREFADIPEYQTMLEQLRPLLDYDQILVNSFYKGPVVLGYTFFSEGETSETVNKGLLPEPVLQAGAFEGMNTHAPHAAGYGVNLPIIQQSAVASGHTSRGLDADGIVRRVPMLMEYGGNYYESLSLAITRFMLVVDEIEPLFSSAAEGSIPDIQGLKIGDHVIPVDVNVQALVPYRGDRFSYRYVSAVDVIKGQVPVESLQNRIILIGTSAKGLVDLRPTPVNSEFPGVEIHANLISGMLDQSIKHSPVNLWWIEYLQLLFIGLLLSFLFPILSPVWVTITAMSMMVLTVAFNLSLWHYLDLVVPLASSLLLIAVIYLITLLYGFFVERRGKQQLSNLFGQYVPPELVDEMSIDPASYIQGAQTREMSVLFSDVRGFTTLSEGLGAAELSELMNLYLTPMTKIIHENRGTIDKYMGDAIMAFWGAPLRDPDHARHALDTGLAMLERLSGIQDVFRSRGWPDIHIGIGINSGIMSVGDMGSEFRMAYTVLGDAVNLGSRLEGLTKTYGVEIIVSDSTRQAVPDYVFRELDVVRVKGKDAPVSIYEPLAPEDQVSEHELSEIALHNEALNLFRTQAWDRAEDLFRQLQDLFPARKLYGIYLQRIVSYRAEPPGADWDGVFTHTSK